jgi:hypothetical protein
MGKNRQHKNIRHLTRILLFGLASVYLHLSAQAAGQLIVHDFIPDLDAFSRIAPPKRESRAKLFAQLVIRPHPEVYNRPQIFKTDLETLERYLDELPEYLPAIKHLQKSFEEQRASIQARFQNAFPDFDTSKARVYLILSLFRFDGKIPHDNPRTLLFGLDGIAKFHGADARLSVILSHELFHVYHFQVNPLPRDIDEVQLYRLVWQEGLATYVSKVLNPDASLADIFLDPRLAVEGPKYVPLFAQSLLTQLESKDDATAARYLSYRRGGQTPARLGYLIGYEIAKRAAANHQLAELARLRGGELLNLMRSEVKSLATGGDKPQITQRTQIKEAKQIPGYPR